MGLVDKMVSSFPRVSVSVSVGVSQHQHQLTTLPFPLPLPVTLVALESNPYGRPELIRKEKTVMSNLHPP